MSYEQLLTYSFSEVLAHVFLVQFCQRHLPFFVISQTSTLVLWSQLWETSSRLILSSPFHFQSQDGRYRVVHKSKSSLSSCEIPSAC